MIPSIAANPDSSNINVLKSNAVDPNALRVMRMRASSRLPYRATEGSTCFDLYADLGGAGNTILVHDMPVVIPTGIAVAPPEGYAVEIRPRSGLSGRGVACPLGTIDADYRGELIVLLHCVTRGDEYKVMHGDRVAQMAIVLVHNIGIVEVDSLDETKRGTGGFGSTGSR